MATIFTNRGLKNICFFLQDFSHDHLNIIDVIMYHVCLIGNSLAADVTVTKIAGYVRVRILMNR